MPFLPIVTADVYAEARLTGHFRCPSFTRSTINTFAFKLGGDISRGLTLHSPSLVLYLYVALSEYTTSLGILFTGIEYLYILRIEPLMGGRVEWVYPLVHAPLPPPFRRRLSR